LDGPDAELSAANEKHRQGASMALEPLEECRLLTSALAIREKRLHDQHLDILATRYAGRSLKVCTDCIENWRGPLQDRPSQATLTTN
jgi:hypothetical protein